MSSSWRPLKLASPNDQLPPLLISCTFTKSSYTIHVTDLTNFWSESLEKRAIERRSEDEETTINPLNNAEQLKILLGKLEDGLAGKSETSLSLSSRKGRNRSEPASLVLNIIATLPKPLKPLKWPVHLQDTSQSALTSHLTIPLIRAQNNRLKELEWLIETLKDKDHVIQKLVDRLETTGADLTSVFAAAAGKNGKALPRKQAEERIKGLEIFDPDLWRKSAESNEKNSGADSIKHVLEEVFDIENGLAIGKIVSDDPVEWEDWWQNLEDVNIELSKSPHVIRAAKAKAVTEPDDQEDDFQVQATPPPRDEGHDKHMGKTPARKTIPSKAADDSTEDEDDELDVPSQRSTAVVLDSLPLSQPSPQPKRLGKIGGTKPKAPIKEPADPTPEIPEEPQENDNPSGDDTVTEDEDAPLPPKVASSAKITVSLLAAKPKKVGLGKIGGKKKEHTIPTTDDEEDEKAKTIVNSPKTSKVPSTRKLEDHGGEENVIHKLRGQPGPVKKDETPEPEAEPENEETDMERADRKREEMRRELEQKAKAPPKKRRKF